VAEWGHKRGIPTTSHYHYPALHFGVDGMEHLGATSRFGYSRTISPSGAGYEDVISLFTHAGARRTPTIFQSAPMYAEDPHLADDPRIKALQQKYGVVGLPKVVFVAPDGTIVDSTQGFVPPEEFLPKMQGALASAG
jgi:hypothetical protein